MLISQILTFTVFVRLEADKAAQGTMVARTELIHQAAVMFGNSAHLQRGMA